PSSAGGAADPAAVTGDAEVERQAAVDLAHRLLLGQPLQLGQELLDLRPDVPGEVLGGERRRRRVGDGLDGDAVEGAAARPAAGPSPPQEYTPCPRRSAGPIRTSRKPT